MIIDCISDLHGYYPKLEGGDLLIVAGDMTKTDSQHDWNDFENWLFNQNYKEKIIIAGNHDNFLQSMDEHRMWKYWDKIPHVTYLCDSGYEFEYEEQFRDPPSSKISIDVLITENKKLKIWGSPWTKWFEGVNPKCTAFMLKTEEELIEKWSLIPDDVDILVTHSPPWGCFDYTLRKESVGSLSLWMKDLSIRPKLHIFGHIHEAYGNCIHANGIHLINCSYVNEHYKPVNKPVMVVL